MEETQHTPQNSMDFPVSFASPGSGKSPSGLPGSFKCPEGYRGGVWGGEGGERGETLGEVGMKAPSHFGVHFHKKAGPKKTSQKRFPI